MATRIGKTIKLEGCPGIIANAAIVGKKEGEGPLCKEFDRCVYDPMFGKDSWESAESELLRQTIQLAIEKAMLSSKEVDAVFAGDLLNQCTGSSFGIRSLNVPFVGMFGACSTMALTLLTASLAIESGGFSRCVAATSSHFCSAEKQFRMPLEYGGQRPPTAQWTVTGSGAAVLSNSDGRANPRVTALHVGTIVDLGITDANNMGAAMAPAAKKTVADFLADTGTSPNDYDLILTGDLGAVGTTLLHELLSRESGIELGNRHKDCGLMMFERKRQDVHSGGSGCGCSASILCSHVLNRMRTGEYNRVLFVATGALLSPLSSLQGESVPGIAHAVLIEN